MSSFDTAFAAWLMFVSNLETGAEPVDLKTQLLPPANRTEIARLAEAIGFMLPADYISLYLASNGQIDPYGDDVTFEQIYSPVFGWYELLPLDKVLDNYNELSDIRESILPDIYKVEVREGDPVAAVAWQPGWVPFAVSNAAYYGVDLVPLRGGSYGQVIEWGHGTSENRVLATSITEFLELAVQNLDRDEPNRYDYIPPESGDGYNRPFASFFFDMDWTRTPPEPMNESDYEQPAELMAWNDANHTAVDAFIVWLEGKGYSAEQLDVFKRWTFEMHMPMSTKMGGLLSPPMPGKMQMSFGPSSELYELASLELALRASSNYIVEDLPVSLEEAFTLLNEYRLEMGIWSQQQFDVATRVISRDRPARLSITDEQANSVFTSIDVQANGSLLLCVKSYDADGTRVQDCQEFVP